MPKMIAKRAFRYAEIPLEKGTEFHASDRDAKTLVVIGSADYIEDETPKRQKRRYRRQDMRAET